MQNPKRQQNAKSVPLGVQGLDSRTDSFGFRGFIRRAASDVAVRLAIWAGDAGNHEESLSLRSTSPAFTAHQPSSR